VDCVVYATVVTDGNGVGVWVVCGEDTPFVTGGIGDDVTTAFISVVRVVGATTDTEGVGIGVPLAGTTICS